MDFICREITLRHGRQSRQQTLSKMKELQRSIDGWEGKVITQCCNEFVLGMYTSEQHFHKKNEK